MKKYGIAVLAVTFILSMVVSGQEQMQGFPKHQKQGQKNEFRQKFKEKLTPKKRAGYMAVDMDLTESQRDKLQALFEKQDKQRVETMEELKKIREQQMNKRDAMMKANAAEMEKILGTDKYNELKAKEANRRDRVKQFKSKHFGKHDKAGLQGRQVQRQEHGQGQGPGRSPRMENKEPELKK